VRAHVLSDLHLKYAPFDAPQVAADVVILAGDIDRGANGVRWARTQFGMRPVLYVPGNHEFYRGCVEDVLAACAGEAMREGAAIAVLQNSECVIEGVAFLGATLWSGFGLFGVARRSAVIDVAREAVRDFRLVEVRPPAGGRVPLDPDYVARAFARSLAWLQARTRWHHAAGHRVCVVTHFAPSRGSLARRHRDDPVSAYFVNDLDDWLRAEGPELWIHGHTHDGFDYRVGPTRVVCNARGYPGERDTTDTLPFDPAFTVEI
jgi:Icc-related predicted phosphoesterase